MSTPLCPTCGGSMKQRKSAKGDFWGCQAFPGCRGTRPIAGTSSTPPSKPVAPAQATIPTMPPGPSAPSRTDHMAADLRRAAELLTTVVEILTAHRAEIEALQVLADHDTSF